MWLLGRIAELHVAAGENGNWPIYTVNEFGPTDSPAYKLKKGQLEGREPGEQVQTEIFHPTCDPWVIPMTKKVHFHFFQP